MAQSRISTRRLGASGAVAALLLGILPHACANAAPADAGPQAALLRSIMSGLAALPDRQAGFTEEKHLASLAAPVHDSGTLLFRHPAHLEKITAEPRPERLIVDGDRLTIQEGTAPPRDIDLAAHPGLRALTATIVAVLAGDLPALRRGYAVAASGEPNAWRIVLHPADPNLARFVQDITIDGRLADVHSLAIKQGNGDTQSLTIDPGR
jgi:hypothetical protein